MIINGLLIKLRMEANHDIKKKSNIIGYVNTYPIGIIIDYIKFTSNEQPILQVLPTISP